MAYKRKYTKRKPRRKRYSKKRLYRKQMKHMSKTACSFIDNHDLEILWNNGLGDFAYNTALENLATGPQRWNRLGSIIKPLGYKVNIDCRYPAQILDTGNANTSAAFPLVFKFIVFQYKNKEVVSTTYNEIKQDNQNDGTSYYNPSTDVFASNNPFTRDHYKIIYEKTFTMEPQYYHESSGVAVTEFAPRTAPSWINKTIYIPGKKMLEIKFKQGSPLGTTTGGIGYVVCGQGNTGFYNVNAVPTMTVSGILYYEP